MSLTKSVLTLSISAIVSTTLWAEENTEEQQTDVQKLPAIVISAHPLYRSDADFGVKDLKVSREKLQQVGTTLGEALKDEPGIYSNTFGAGASHPVIRGQEGARVKVTQNATETMDVSGLSPDHAVTIDPQLAENIEVIRGPSALLYGAGSVGGLVNVTDTKMPTKMPENGYEANVGARYNTGNDEKLAHAGVTVGLNDNIALRVEGLKRDANEYITPNYMVTDDHGNTSRQRRVKDTFSESDNVNVGLSWIGARGFAGISYGKREDKYGLPGHNHEYESCHRHGMELHCGEHEDGGGTAAVTDPATTPAAGGHSHNHGPSQGAEEEEAGPWINLKSERYDFRSELEEPFAGFKKLRAQASYTDYTHAEIEGDEAASTFNSKGYEGRIELVHHPVADWEGVVGVQASQQKLDITGEEAILAPNKTQKYSVFGLEHKQWNDFHFELGARFDHQKVDINSDQQDFDGNGFSYSGAVNWEFAPNYKLSLVGSHEERLPLAQELYADGVHPATNTYELGNDQLSKEKSNNVELGLHYNDQKLSYHLHLYHNWFDNYIYARTQDRYKDFRLIQYAQDSAKFYGTEGEVAYQLTSVYNASLFGDYVRGKIDGENAPRVPSGRLGTRVNASFDDHWSGSAEYYHVFKQDDIASFETETSGYNMLNVGVAYKGKYGSDQQDYRLFFNANNLLDDNIYEHSSFLASIPQMGRNFVMGVDFKF
ncbi:zinc piracy TonB-dependent receptor ZnuD [Acinetobacter sp. WZC-1]|uniref:zinc piracy TonB-dependent receptor ZnuD n=1 Tax=Acinetobacter sp. WZC-1 TaxID=3459034 RepID=UPI00403DC2F2